MKTFFFRTAVLILLAGLIVAVVVFGAPLYARRAEDSTLTTVGRRAHEITAVEVIRLAEEGESGPAGSYLVRYDDSHRGLELRQTLMGSRASDCVRRWNEVRFASGYITGCHDPHYILRFLAGRRCLFEAAVCFHCQNVSWQPVLNFTACRQMSNFGEDASRMKALETFLDELK